MLLIKKLKEYLPYYKRNLKVAIPVMLTQIGGALVGLFDTMMVGHYATVDLAAVSFSNALFFTVMVFASGALMGLTPLIGVQDGEMSKYPEKGDIIRRKIASLLQNGLYFTLIIGVITTLLLAVCIPLLGHFGQDTEVVEVARPYYILIVISLLPYLLFCLQKQFLEGLGNTVVAMIIVLTMNALNVLLNWVFIYGHWGAPAMGATGAGIATLVSRVGMPICMFAVIALHRNWRGYLQMFSRRLSSWREVCHIARIGFPIGGQTFFETVTFTLAVVVVGWISKEAIAAHQIATQVSNLTFMLALGIGAGTTIRVSHQLGKGDLPAVRMASNASIHLVVLINTFAAALMIGLRHYIPLLFTEDAEVIAIASQLLIFAGLYQYSDGLQAVGAAMLRGITDVKVPMVIAFVSYIIVGLSVGLVCAFPLDMGAAGIWVGFIVGLTFAAVLFHTRFNKKYRKMCLSVASIEK
mgnify:CR=1 FL=1